MLHGGAKIWILFSSGKTIFTNERSEWVKYCFYCFCYFIERIFDPGTYRLAHREQRVVDGLGGEAKKEKNLRSGHTVKI